MPFCSTVLIDSCTSCVVVEQLVGFLRDQDGVGIVHGDAPRLGAAAAELAENVADIDGADLRARHAGNFEHRHAEPPDCTSISISLSSSSLVRSVLRKLSRVAGAGAGADQSVEHALLGGLLGARLHVLALSLAGERDGNLDQVAHDLLDVAADITHFGEFGRFNLEERRARQPREAAGDFGLADAGRPDHQDVLRQHFLAQFVVELQAPPAVAQSDGDGALGVVLADDEAVEFGNDFTRGGQD